MAEGGAGFNPVDSMLRANPAVQITAYQGGGMTAEGYEADGGAVMRVNELPDGDMKNFFIQIGIIDKSLVDKNFNEDVLAVFDTAFSGSDFANVLRAAGGLVSKAAAGAAAVAAVAPGAAAADASAAPVAPGSPPPAPGPLQPAPAPASPVAAEASAAATAAAAGAVGVSNAVPALGQDLGKRASLSPTDVPDIPDIKSKNLRDILPEDLLTTLKKPEFKITLNDTEVNQDTVIANVYKAITENLPDEFDIPRLHKLTTFYLYRYLGVPNSNQGVTRLNIINLILQFLLNRLQTNTLDELYKVSYRLTTQLMFGNDDQITNNHYIDIYFKVLSGIFDNWNPIPAEYETLKTKFRELEATHKTGVHADIRAAATIYDVELSTYIPREVKDKYTNLYDVVITNDEDSRNAIEQYRTILTKALSTAFQIAEPVALIFVDACIPHVLERIKAVDDAIAKRNRDAAAARAAAAVEEGEGEEEGEEEEEEEEEEEGAAAALAPAAAPGGAAAALAPAAAPGGAAGAPGGAAEAAALAPAAAPGGAAGAPGGAAEAAAAEAAAAEAAAAAGAAAAPAAAPAPAPAPAGQPQAPAQAPAGTGMSGGGPTPKFLTDKGEFKTGLENFYEIVKILSYNFTDFFFLYADENNTTVTDEIKPVLAFIAKFKAFLNIVAVNNSKWSTYSVDSSAATSAKSAIGSRHEYYTAYYKAYDDELEQLVKIDSVLAEKQKELMKADKLYKLNNKIKEIRAADAAIAEARRTRGADTTILEKARNELIAERDVIQAEIDRSKFMKGINSFRGTAVAARTGTGFVKTGQAIAYPFVASAKAIKDKLFKLGLTRTYAKIYKTLSVKNIDILILNSLRSEADKATYTAAVTIVNNATSPSEELKRALIDIETLLDRIETDAKAAGQTVAGAAASTPAVAASAAAAAPAVPTGAPAGPAAGTAAGPPAGGGRRNRSRRVLQRAE